MKRHLLFATMGLAFATGAVARDGGEVDRLIAAPVVVDLRNVYRRDDGEGAGFAYAAVGR